MGKKIIREDGTEISMYAPGDGMLSFNRNYNGKSCASADDITEAEARALLPDGWELFKDGPYWRAREIKKAPACPKCGGNSHIYASLDVKWNPEAEAWEVCPFQDDELECTECDTGFIPEDAGLPPIPDFVPSEALQHLKAVRDAFNEPYYGDRDQQSYAAFDALEKAKAFLEKMEA